MIYFYSDELVFSLDELLSMNDGPVASSLNAWAFEVEGQVEVIRVTPKLTVNVNHAAVSAATQGLGIAMTSAWACRDELQSQRLLPVLDKWSLSEAEIIATLPGGMPPRHLLMPSLTFWQLNAPSDSVEQKELFEKMPKVIAIAILGGGLEYSNWS